MPEKQVGKRIPEKELVEHWQILGSLWFAVITSDTVVGVQGEKGQQSQVTLIASSQQGPLEELLKDHLILQATDVKLRVFFLTTLVSCCMCGFTIQFLSLDIIFCITKYF